MKKHIYIYPLLIFILAGTGCKKYLDVNHDPNNPVDVQESLLLFPIEAAISTTVAGGDLSLGNYTTTAVVDCYWTQQIAFNQPPPDASEYSLHPADMDQQWLQFYATIFTNLRILNNKAEANSNYAYAAIAKTLTAYTLGIITDHVGDAPYSKGFDGKTVVPYDTQEQLYTTMLSLLDSAIAESALAPGALQPGSDDVLYNGSMDNWVKFAYALKARNDIHLTKAPGHDAVTQSNLALQDAAKAFAANADEAVNKMYTGNAGGESPWSEIPANGGNVIASTFLNSLKSRNDPRLRILCDTSAYGLDSGRVIGTAPDGDVTVYSQVGSFYSDPAAPVYIFNYTEILFIQAEAAFRTGNLPAANLYFQYGINASMAKLGKDTTAPAVVAYVATRLPLTSGNALQRIIEEKFVSNFLNMENYNDWRRTGFPVLNPVAGGAVPTIPRREVYPLAELTANPQPQQSLLITDRVWWDAQ
jgi:hypothetical protein